MGNSDMNGPAQCENQRNYGVPLAEVRREEMLRAYAPDNITLVKNEVERRAEAELTSLDVMERLHSPYDKAVERTRCREQFLIQLGSLVQRQDYFAKHLTKEDKSELRKITEALLDIIDGKSEAKKK